MKERHIQNAGATGAGRAFPVVKFVLVILVGLSALFSGGSLLFRPGYENRAGALLAALMGVVLIGAAGWRIYRAGAVRPATQEIRRPHSDQPWMNREDWAARRVIHTSAGVAAALWMWTLGWWGLLSFDKIARALADSWWNAAVLAIFVGAGFIGLSLAVRSTLHWRRYGTSALQLETLPAYVGDAFRGTLEARLHPKPRHPLDVELACEDVRWVTSSQGKDRSTRLEVKRLGAQRAKIEAAGIAAVQDGIRARIVVEAPANLPGHTRDERGNGVRWVLSVATSGDDPAFSCVFEVPVFERAKERA
jgi:hypothetical protein